MDQPPSHYEEHKGAGVKFTRPDGSPIYVNPRSVQSVGKGPDGNAIIQFNGGGRQAVKESVEIVIELIYKDMPEGQQ